MSGPTSEGIDQDGRGCWVAFDVGGTFVDIMVGDSAGSLRTYKLLALSESLGNDVARCIERALDELRVPSGSTRVLGIMHGTTIASNAVLEGTGAVAGLITTEGFRDEIEMRRLARPGVYDVFWTRTAALIPRRLRLEVPERMRVDGRVDHPLDTSAVEGAVQRLVAHGVASVAVSFLHAYANPSHERQVREILTRLAPELAVSLSSDVLPEAREYERTSTTAMNATLLPVVDRYLDRLETELDIFGAPIRVMQSNGGVMSAAMTRIRPVNMIESGPAAGVLAAAELSKLVGLENVVAFDMGGTTAKACLIEGTEPIENPAGEVGHGINTASRLSSGAGYAVRVPAFDIAEVGAGGGSIAWIDEGGVLRVGPRSAGAEPGPVCYGRGGRLPTITDANVLCGFMNGEAIAGATVPIDSARAAEVFESTLCAKTGQPLERMAYGVHAVANATMMRAIRAVTTERGRDPRDFAMVAFGGNGSIHALTLADSLGIMQVLVPVYPGLFSALGLLMADQRYDVAESIRAELAELSSAELDAGFAALESRARVELDDAREIAFERRIDLRYARQSSELTIPLGRSSNATDPGAIARAFHHEHALTYGYARPDDPISAVCLRVRATIASGGLSLDELGRGVFEALAVELDDARTRRVYFGELHGWKEARVTSRGALKVEAIVGPAIIEEFDTSIVIPPGWRGSIDPWANVIVDKTTPASSMTSKPRE